ncbi:MAG: response regulator [Ignavibacteriales bacterium]|nr:MAG: response regulator [Ignavibacteriales bacterium]
MKQDGTQMGKGERVLCIHNSMNMKKIVFYSPDFTLNLSLLMFLQSNYNITTTTDIVDLKAIASSFSSDLIILDSPPTIDIETLCKEIKEFNPKTPIILLYVFDNKLKIPDENIRKYVNSVFYKPFDLDNVTKQLSVLTS